MSHRYPFSSAACLALLVACSKQSRHEPPPPSIDIDAGGPQVDAAVVPTPPAPPPRACSGDGWCWAGPGTFNDALYAVAGPAQDDLWAVGELGLVLHFDGERWDTRWAPSRETLRALAVVGGDVWVVGEHATLHHYATGAAAWQTEQIPELPEDAALRGVWTDGERLVVVGAAGVLFERAAGAWSSSTLANGVALNAVWSDGTETWAVGDGGMVLRKNADGWSRVDAGTGQNLSAVGGRSGAVWIAGANGDVRRFDVQEGAWQRPTGQGPAPVGVLRAIAVGSDHVSVANEAGRVFTWDETTTCPVPGDAGAPEQPCPEWSETHGTPGDSALFGLWASGERLVGVGALGSITRWDGASRVAESPATLDNYLDVSGTSDDDVWVAGDRLIRVQAGARLDIDKDSPRALYAVQPLDTERTLIAGTGGLARGYSSDGWQDMDVRADAWLRALFTDGASGWLVGNRGAAWGLLNGRVWTPLVTPTDQNLLAVFGVPRGAVWAVGSAGVILRHDGTQWAVIPSGPNGGVSAELRGVWGTADDDVWAVGTGGTALHWDGRVWTRVGDEATYSLNAVWGRTRNDIWAAGSGGVLLHFDGQTWQPEHSGTAQSINALWGGSRKLWAVGEHGTLLSKDLD